MWLWGGFLHEITYFLQRSFYGCHFRHDVEIFLTPAGSFRIPNSDIWQEKLVVFVLYLTYLSGGFISVCFC